MRDFVVEVLYQDVNNETQQEVFEVSAPCSDDAQDCVRKLLISEGAKITYLKWNSCNTVRKGRSC